MVKILPPHPVQQQYASHYLTEVIGGNGRIGSQFMYLCDHPIVVPYGVCPGSLSSSTTTTMTTTKDGIITKPIYVCTPASAWSHIYETTILSRRSDLVFVGNGLLPSNIPLLVSNHDDTSSGHDNNDHTRYTPITIVIPHYAITKVGERPTCTGTSSPPTYIAGKHSKIVEQLLRKDGIHNIQRYHHITIDIIQFMIQKLVWTSCLWLLCHTMTNPNGSTLSLTVSQVHRHYSNEVYTLVQELWPSIRDTFQRESKRIHKQSNNDILDNNNNNDSKNTNKLLLSLSMDEMIQYMEQYSFSIPNAIPNIDLAIKEIHCRNQVLATNSKEQPIHYQLLQQVFQKYYINNPSTDNNPMDLLKNIFHSQPASTTTALLTNKNQIKIYDLRSTIGFAVYGQSRATRAAMPITTTVSKLSTTTTETKIENNYSIDISNSTKNDDDRKNKQLRSSKKVVIVGAGILGSSIAMNLVRQQLLNNNTQQLHITVIDGNCNNMNHSSNTTTATAASFGWINANYMKQPSHYQTFNVLGIHAWYHDPLLRSLPRWNGSVVRASNTIPKMITDTTGYYNRPIGPLSATELHDLEPNVTFLSSSSIATTPDNDHRTSSPSLSSDTIYYFPNDGFVDPCDAVQAMRTYTESSKIPYHVNFIWNHTVLRILPHPDQTNRYILEYYPTNNDLNEDNNIANSSYFSTIDADSIVIAAGTGSSNVELGGLPMQTVLNCTGCTTHFNTDHDSKLLPPSTNMINQNDKYQSSRLQRIVVDMVNEIHILQRRNGTVVVGGGSPLQVGGSNGCTNSNNNPLTNESSFNYNTVIEACTNITPSLLSNRKIEDILVAQRPIPLDGLPAIGYYTDCVECKQQDNTASTISLHGIYSLVSHSGITLAPILGALAALEIMDESLSLDILNPFRPNRLFQYRTM
jgi:glycine/D-amino acid oxidase-like deaminating enzyme